MTTTHIVEFSDVTECFLSHCGNDTGEQCNVTFGTSSHALRATSWAGGSFADTARWIREGFYSPEMETAGTFNLTSPRRRRVWDEFDGDPDIDRLLQADDNPFRTTRRVKESREGITINVEMSMNAGTNPSIVTQYGAWVARLIAGLESHGHDLEVNITLSVQHGWERDSQNTVRRILIPVKRFGELSDFTNWSVMFSPTGFRHVGFTALIMAAGMNNRRVAHDYGTSAAPGWTVAYDAAEGTLNIGCPRNGVNFPSESMSAQLRETGISAE